jgi:hypothetical protein
MVRTLLATGFLCVLSGCSSQPLSEPSGDGAPTGSPIAPEPGSEAPPADDYVLIAYPPGPYGYKVGSVIENLEFLGWHDPVAAGYDAAEFEVVRLSDYYDPNGQDLKLIVLNASAVWCSVCRSEYRHFRDMNIHATYRARGVQLFGALFEDINAAPARPEDLSEWGASPAFTVEFPLVLDPGFKLGKYFTSDSTPLNLIIDARTMRILDATMGYDPSPTSSYWALVDALLAAQ